MMAESNMLADRDEDFNTRYGSYRGWQMAIERVKPIPRATLQVDLAAMVRAAGLTTTEQVVDHFLARLMSVPIGAAERRDAGRLPRPRARHLRHRARRRAIWRIRCARWST